MKLTKELYALVSDNVNSSVSEGADTMKYQGKTITKRKDGRWWTRYYDNYGKQKSVYGRTQEQCKSNLKKALHEKEIQKAKLIKQEAYKDEKMLFEWLIFWNDTYKKPFNKTDIITNQIKNHIFPKMKDKPLSQISGFELQKAINDTPGTRTKEDIYNILNNSFLKAYETNLIQSNPMISVIKPQHQRKKGKALTRTEEKQFLNKIKNSDYEKLFKFYLLTGVRRSEALSLNKADIDWDNKQITIKGTKTLNAYRTIPLFNSVSNLLKTIKPNEQGYYFNINKDTLTHEFKKYCPNHKLHDLRHTFATRCLEQKINMKTVQCWLGHADYSTTANIYSSVQSDFINEQTNTLNQYFDSCFDTHK